MREGEAFLQGLDRKAKTFAAAARTTVKANDDLCSWLLDPLARWAQGAYGGPLKMRQKAMHSTAWGCGSLSRCTRKTAGILLNQCPSWFQRSTSTKATWFRTCGRPS